MRLPVLLSFTIIKIIIGTMTTALAISSRKTTTILPYLSKIRENYKIVLASGSPRRKELVGLMGIPDFDVLVSNFPENLDPDHFSHPSEYCLATARNKVEAVARSIGEREENFIVIGADTIVCLDNEILEKPKDLVDSKRMISKLNGQQHSVYTGVVIYSNGFRTSPAKRPLELATMFAEGTEVVFGNLTEADIDGYVATREGMDKAGAYGIQGIGSTLVERINGCYFNVMGLPVHRLSSAIAEIVSKHVEN